mmetsp:Transcript_29763/g.45549  ORF Transcript_29763/g.45549 Transcript_29763/m.45549 type:complete len:99 (-) Transcript_29763:110-406(-)
MEDSDGLLVGDIEGLDDGWFEGIDDTDGLNVGRTVGAGDTVGSGVTNEFIKGGGLDTSASANGNRISDRRAFGNMIFIFVPSDRCYLEESYLSTYLLL